MDKRAELERTNARRMQDRTPNSADRPLSWREIREVVEIITKPTHMASSPGVEVETMWVRSGEAANRDE